MKSPQEIINILRSIQDVRLNEKREFEVRFTDSVAWETNNGYIYNSFTEQLLCLIEDSLEGKLNE